MPILDIVIPTYNRKNELTKTLDSLIPHMDERITVTVIDNASNYNISNLQETFKNKKSVNFITNEYNIGSTLNYIKCLNTGKSNYIWIICDDDECNFQGLSELCDYLTQKEPDILMVGESVNSINIFSTDNNQRLHGNTLAEVYKKNISNIAFSFGFVPSLLFKRNLIKKQILEELTLKSDSYYPQVWLQYYISSANFNIYKKSFIKKPEDFSEVSKLFHFQTSWLKMAWEIAEKKGDMKDLQKIILPNLKRAIFRIIDGVAINIKHESTKKTIPLIILNIFYTRGIIKIAPIIALFATLTLGKLLPHLRSIIWSNNKIRRIFLSRKQQAS